MILDVALAWLVVAPLLAVLIGKGITLADKQERPDLNDHFDGIPAECLSQAEVDRRIERFEAWL